MQNNKTNEIELQAAKNSLDTVMALHELSLLSNFKEAPLVEIEEIPLKLTKFIGIKNSYWQRIKTDASKTSCRFILGANECFSAHVHPFAAEKVTILTKGAKIKWVDERGIYYYEYGDVITVPKGMIHALVNLVDFPIEFRVDWTPASIGWSAIFTEKHALKNYKNK